MLLMRALGAGARFALRLIAKGASEEIYRLLSPEPRRGRI